MLRRWVLRILIAVLAVVGLTILYMNMSAEQSVIRLHGHRYSTQIMQTPEELQQGLSGTKSLPQGNAMLFVFPSDDKWGIWMKDMNYPIDIVWLDNKRLVVYMVKNAKPSSYPDTTFRPDKNTRYVIELPSGTIEQTDIQIGDPAGLPSGV